MDTARDEVYRYLGRRGQQITSTLDELVTDGMAQVNAAAEPRHVRKTFIIQSGADGIHLDKNLVLTGNDIGRHLCGCVHAVLIAATLGLGIEKLIRRHSQTDISYAMILDACATQMIEQYCGEIDEQIQKEAESDGLFTVSRFSPGYGDLPLDIQPDILSVLDAGRRIGLTCTNSLILLPRKSVTAVIGIGKTKTAKIRGCDSCCMKRDCAYAAAAEINNL